MHGIEALVIALGFVVGLNAFWSKEILVRKLAERKQRRDSEQ